MSQNSVDNGVRGTSILLAVPAKDPDLFGKKASDDVLTFLSRHPFDSFSQRELAMHTEYSASAVQRAVDVLEANDLVDLDAKGNRTAVSINRERLSIPENPFVRIPQSQFQLPVKTAVDRLREALTDCLGIVLYGSVARGEADRRSDIDLWTVVETERAANQRRANEIERELEDQRFEGDRYDFHIVVDSIESIPQFTDDVSRILRSGIPVHETETFEKLHELLVHGEFDE